MISPPGAASINKKLLLPGKYPRCYPLSLVGYLCMSSALPLPLQAGRRDARTRPFSVRSRVSEFGIGNDLAPNIHIGRSHLFHTSFTANLRMAAFFHTADVKDKVQERGKTFTQKKRILAALIVVRVRDYHLYLSGRVDGSASLLCQKGVHCLVVVVTVTVTGRKTLLLFPSSTLRQAP